MYGTEVGFFLRKNKNWWHLFFLFYECQALIGYKNETRWRTLNNSKVKYIYVFFFFMNTCTALINLSAPIIKLFHNILSILAHILHPKALLKISLHFLHYFSTLVGMKLQHNILFTCSFSLLSYWEGISVTKITRTFSNNYNNNTAILISPVHFYELEKPLPIVAASMNW